jgi:hypothetical protein
MSHVKKNQQVKHGMSGVLNLMMIINTDMESATIVMLLYELITLPLQPTA